MKIYIFEKNENIVKELEKILLPYNFEIKNFTSISKFKEEFSKNRPDLFITSPVFEGLSPYHIVKYIRVELNDLKTPIIVYYHNPNKEILTLAKKYRVSSFIIYPFNRDDLIKRIFKLLGISEKVIEKQDVKDINIIKKNRILDEIKRRIDKLPPFPSVIHEIEKLLNDKKSSASDFEEVIKKDQVITAKVLKIVNSPFFSLSRKISTISESVAYIGFDTLRSVIYSAYASKLMNVSLPAYGYKKNELWKHSYYTASFAKEISKIFKFQQKEQEEMFIGGLLHDIGKLVLGDLAKEQKVFFYKDEMINSGLIQIEKKYLIFNHQEVGELIGKKWLLPEVHIEIIKKHHFDEIDSKFKERILIANVADYISKLLLNITITEFDNEKKEKALEKLNINEKDFEFIIEKCKTLIEKLDTGIF